MNVKVKMKVTIKGETFLKTATVKCQSQRLNFGNKKRRSKTPLQITPRSLSQSERQVEGGGAFPGGRSEPRVELTRGQTTLNWKVPSRSEFTQGQSSLRVRLRLRDVNWKVHSRTQFTQGQSSLKVRVKIDSVIKVEFRLFEGHALATEVRSYSSSQPTQYLSSKMVGRFRDTKKSYTLWHSTPEGHAVVWTVQVRPSFKMAAVHEHWASHSPLTLARNHQWSAVRALLNIGTVASK